MFGKSLKSLLFGILTAGILSTLSVSVYAQNKYEDSYNYQRGLEALNNSDYATGIDYLIKEVSSHNDNGYAHFYLAITYQYYEDYGRALTSINSALTAYRISNCYEEQGNWKQAIEYVAKSNKVGLWVDSSPIAPWDFRATKKK